MSKEPKVNDKKKIDVDNLKGIAIEKFCWSIVEKIGWGMKSTNYKAIGAQLKKEYEKKDIERLKSFVKEKRLELKAKLYEYKAPGKWGTGDDGFWDLTAHIVGLGKEKYLGVVEAPAIAEQMAKAMDYKENFEYIFSYAK